MIQSSLIGPATLPGTRLSVKAKCPAKNFALTVKPAARAKVKAKTKMLFKETIKVGGSKASVYKTLKLIRK